MRVDKNKLPPTLRKLAFQHPLEEVLTGNGSKLYYRPFKEYFMYAYTTRDFQDNQRDYGLEVSK